MPQKHTPAYPAEFRERLVELVRSGRSPEELSKEFEPSAQTIRNWVAQADRDAGKRSDGTFEACVATKKSGLMGTITAHLDCSG